VGHPSVEAAHHRAKLIERTGFVHLTPPAENATELGGAIAGIAAVLPCEGIDNDAHIHRGIILLAVGAGFLADTPTTFDPKPFHTDVRAVATAVR
jgi:hypothetical protein